MIFYNSAKANNGWFSGDGALTCPLKTMRVKNSVSFENDPILVMGGIGINFRTTCLIPNSGSREKQNGGAWKERETD